MAQRVAARAFMVNPKSPWEGHLGVFVVICGVHVNQKKLKKLGHFLVLFLSAFELTTRTLRQKTNPLPNLQVPKHTSRNPLISTNIN